MTTNTNIILLLIIYFLEKASYELRKKQILCEIQRLYYDRFDVFEENDFNKANVSKECDICHY